MLVLWVNFNVAKPHFYYISKMVASYPSREVCRQQTKICLYRNMDKMPDFASVVEASKHSTAPYACVLPHFSRTIRRELSLTHTVDPKDLSAIVESFNPLCSVCKRIVKKIAQLLPSSTSQLKKVCVAALSKVIPVPSNLAHSVCEHALNCVIHVEDAILPQLVERTCQFVHICPQLADMQSAHDIANENMCPSQYECKLQLSQMKYVLLHKISYPFGLVQTPTWIMLGHYLQEVAKNLGFPSLSLDELSALMNQGPFYWDTLFKIVANVVNLKTECLCNCSNVIEEHCKLRLDHDLVSLMNFAFEDDSFSENRAEKLDALKNLFGMFQTNGTSPFDF